MTSKSCSKKSAFPVLVSLAILAPMVLTMATACSPNDEKVSTRTPYRGGSGGGTTETNAKLGDRVGEYSRAMLIELADAARQTETVLQTVAQLDVSPGPEATPGAPLKVASCKERTTLPSPAGSVSFRVTTRDCKEAGPTFIGSQYGPEDSFAMVSQTQGQPALATVIKVVGRGVETILNPVANDRDALRLKTNRFLDAKFIGEKNGERLYSFSFENYVAYDLNLKFMTDLGSLKSAVSGVFVYDVATKTLTAFRSVSEQDGLSVKIVSAREGKSGGKVVRQEFFGSAKASEMKIDLASCALPTGVMQSRFTIKPLVKDATYVVDTKTEFESSKEHLVDKKKPSTSGKALGLSAKLCTSDQQITMTEFFSGLLY